MGKPPSKRNTTGSEDTDWLSQLDTVKKTKAERVVQHTPTKKERPVWKYTLKEGGQIYRINAPTTKDMVDKVKKQLENPHSWRQYARSPHGGDRNYTQITCFPPFDILRVAEVFLPDGTCWNSRKRKYVTMEKDD